jgi:hypothetical protein
MEAIYTDNDGTRYDLEGDDLPDLAKELVGITNNTSSIRVLTEQGFTRGWISVENGTPHWKHG